MLLLASEIPLVRKEVEFVAADLERLIAMGEAAEATDPETEYVAVSVAFHLWEVQQAMISAVLRRIQAEAALGYDVKPATVWVEAWTQEMSAGFVELATRNNELVAQLGKGRAEELGLTHAKPRLERVFFRD